jgi:hypothetical protein
MNLTEKKKQFLLLCILGSMAFIVSVVVICANLCPSDSDGPEFQVSADCSFTSHAFLQAGIGLSALLIIPLSGLFLIMNRSTISDGFYLSLFRPPRFDT